MKELRRLTIASLVVFALSSCTTAIAPVGDRPVSLDASEWEGSWTAYDGDDRWNIRIEVLDPANGELEVTNLFPDDGPGARTVYLREAGPWMFASTLDDPAESDPDSAEPVYSWVRIQATPHLILFWAPDYGRFEELVEEGTLPEPNSSSRARIGRLEPEHYDLMTSGAEGVLFDWDMPGVLVRGDGAND